MDDFEITCLCVFKGKCWLFDVNVSDILQANVIRKTTVLDVMRRLLQARKFSIRFYKVELASSQLGIQLTFVSFCRPKISWFPLMLEQKKPVKQSTYQY